MVTLREALGKFKNTYLLVTVGVLLTILGAKFNLIQRIGSDVPFWDQWDAEGANMYIPSAEGTLHLQTFFAPHNEHRIVYSKALVFLLFKLNGHWDARLQTMVNAVLHVGAIGLLVIILQRRLNKPWFLGTGILIILLFGLPLAWENTLSGFQSPFYFMFLFAVAHLAGTFLAEPRSWAWWSGQICGLLAIFALGSGFFSAVMVFGVLSLRLIFVRRLTATELLALAWNVGLVGLGVLLRNEAPSHASLRSHNFGEFFESFRLLAGWPSPWTLFFPVTLAPMIIVGLRHFKSKAPIGLVDFAVALGGWWLVQVVAIAYARGGEVHGMSPRYFDTLAVGTIASSLLWIQLISHLQWRRAIRRALVSLYLVWLAGVAFGLCYQMDKANEMFLVPLETAVPSRVDTVADFVATGNKDFYQARPWLDVPYPTTERLGSLLSIQILREILPNSIRPPVTVTVSKSSLGFVANGPLPKGKFPAGRPGWSSFGRKDESTAFFRSEPIKPTKARFIRIGVYGDGSSAERSILIETETTRTPIPIPSNAIDAWKYIVVDAPSSPYRIIAESAPGTSLAFTAPVELAFGSWLTRHILKSGGWMMLIGAGFLVLAGLGCPWSDMARKIIELKLSWTSLVKAAREKARSGPEAIPPPPSSASKIAAISFILKHDGKLAVLAAAVFLFIRKADVWLYPQFWAEDGQIFFNHASHFGAAAIFSPYAGYHHFLLRCIATIAMHFDIRYAPTVYVYASVVITLAVISLIFSPRIYLPYKPLIALAVVLVPHTGEVFLNLTNLQWITSLALVILLFKRDASEVGSLIGDTALVLILGITGPFIILLLPLYVLRAIQLQSRASVFVLGAGLLAAAIQVEAMINNPVPASGPANLIQCIEVAGLRTFGRLFLGGPLINLIGVPVAALIGWALGGVLAWTSWRETEYRKTYFSIWFVLVAFTVAAIFRFRGAEEALLLYRMGDRYFFVPSVMVLWILILIGKRRPYLALGAGLLILAANATEFRFPAFEDYHWQDYASRISAGEEKVHVVVNPGFVAYDHTPEGPGDIPGARGRFGEHVLAFVSIWMVFLPIILAQVSIWRLWADRLRPWGLIISVTATTLLGYLTFWAYIASPSIGMLFAASVWLGSIIIFKKYQIRVFDWFQNDTDARDALLASFMIGLAYLAVLHLHGSLSIDHLAATRFVGLTELNHVPYHFAESLMQGASPQARLELWANSDELPLEAGIILLSSSFGRLLHFNFLTVAEAAGLWFQLLWVPIAWLFCRQAGLSKPGTLLVVFAASLAGFFILNSVYVWPKIGGAALVVAAFCIWIRERSLHAFDACLCGILAALGWLSNSNLAFGLIAMVVLVTALPRQARWRNLLAALTGFIVLVTPWYAYQRFYAPPANQTLEMLQNKIASNETQGNKETTRPALQNLTWKNALELKFKCAAATFEGNYSAIWGLGASQIETRRNEQSHGGFLTFWHYNIAWLLLPWLTWKAFRSEGKPHRFLLLCIAWGGLTYLIWIVQLVGDEPAPVLSQSSFTMELIGFLALLSSVLLWSRNAFYILLLYHTLVFFCTWLPESAQLQGPLFSPAVASLVLIGLGAVYCFYKISLPAQAGHAQPPATIM